MLSFLAHCDMLSPISSLLTVFVSSDEREGLYFKEDGTGSGVDAGTVLCTNKGEADVGRQQLYGFAGGWSSYQLTISQQSHGVAKKK